MTRLLFVCTGNICRSAFAERYTAARRPDIDVSSAGTGALVGSPMEATMARQLERHGGTASGFVARQLHATMIAAADLILVMQVHHRTWIIDDHPGAVRRTLTLGQAARATEGIGTGDDLLRHLATHRQHAREQDDVVDPYRRGDAAMQHAADEIAAHLDRLLPLLAE